MIGSKLKKKRSVFVQHLPFVVSAAWQFFAHQINRSESSACYNAGFVKFYRNQSMKCTHVPEIEALILKREKGETKVVFPTARDCTRGRLAYVIRMCYFYGNIKKFEPCFLN